MKHEKRLYSIKEVCDIYGLSRKLIDKAIHSGQLKSIMIDGKQRKLKLSEIDRWLENLTYTPKKVFDFEKSAILIAQNKRT